MKVLSIEQVNIVSGGGDFLAFFAEKAITMTLEAAYAIWEMRDPSVTPQMSDLQVP